jgi:membrane-associated protease RseP (regulator of RpoE activity)
VVNVLPLPALDGGYLALLLLEAMRGGKKLPQEFEKGFMASGFLLLTAMGMGLIVRDTFNLISH